MSPLGIGLEREDDVDAPGVLVRPFAAGIARGETADRAVAPLEMAELAEVGFDRGGEMVEGVVVDVGRRVGARAGVAIKAKRGIKE